MLLRRLLAALFILFTATASRWKDDSVGEKSSEIIGRFFPILPPYHGVDFGANFNKLKSTGDAAYFVVRDSIVVKLRYPHDGRFTIFGKSSIMAPWYICTGSSEFCLLVLKSEYDTNQDPPDTNTYMIFLTFSSSLWESTWCGRWSTCWCGTGKPPPTLIFFKVFSLQVKPSSSSHWWSGQWWGWWWQQRFEHKCHCCQYSHCQNYVWNLDMHCRYYIVNTIHTPGLRDEPATESSDNSRLGLASLSELSPVSCWIFLPVNHQLVYGQHFIKMYTWVNWDRLLVLFLLLVQGKTI